MTPTTRDPLTFSQMCTKSIRLMGLWYARLAVDRYAHMHLTKHMIRSGLTPCRDNYHIYNMTGGVNKRVLELI